MTCSILWKERRLLARISSSFSHHRPWTLAWARATCVRQSWPILALESVIFRWFSTQFHALIRSNQTHSFVVDLRIATKNKNGKKKKSDLSGGDYILGADDWSVRTHLRSFRSKHNKLICNARHKHTNTHADTFRHTRNACDAQGGNQINDKCHISYEQASKWVSVYVLRLLCAVDASGRMKTTATTTAVAVKGKNKTNEKAEWKKRLKLEASALYWYYIIFALCIRVFIRCVVTNEWLYLFALEHAHTPKKKAATTTIAAATAARRIH